jgi:hypothetical protein
VSDNTGATRAGNKQGGESLRTVASLFPTPTTQPTTGNGHARNLGKEVRLLPTPAAGNFNDGESVESWESRRQKNKAKGYNGNGQGTPLAMAVKLIPTPTATDANGGRNLTANRRTDNPRVNLGMTLTDWAHLRSNGETTNSPSDDGKRLHEPFPLLPITKDD